MPGLMVPWVVWTTRADEVSGFFQAGWNWVEPCLIDRWVYRLGRTLKTIHVAVSFRLSHIFALHLKSLSMRNFGDCPPIGRAMAHLPHQKASEEAGWKLDGSWKRRRSKALLLTIHSNHPLSERAGAGDGVGVGHGGRSTFPALGGQRPTRLWIHIAAGNANC